MNKTYTKTKKFHGLSSALNYWLLTNQENCGISVELPLRAYTTLTFGKSTMCFVEGKTSCVCADMFVDWNSCLCWTLWIQNSQWVLLHFMWTVISQLKGDFLIIENLPYIAGIAANKWVEFSISSLSLLFGLVNCITLSNSFYSTNWFYFPSASTMLDNKALKPFFAILSEWNLAKNFNYNNLKKFYYWAVSYYFVILKKYKYFQLQYSRKRLYFEAVSNYFVILEKYMYLSKTTGLYSIILSQAGPFSFMGCYLGNYNAR